MVSWWRVGWWRDGFSVAKLHGGEMTGYRNKESLRNIGRFANESLRQRPVRKRMKSVRQRLYASDFGSQCENTFSFGSKVNERTRNNSLL